MRAAYKDLREFLSVLEQEGQMLRIHDQVLPEPDIAAAACALTEIGENSPAIHFDNIAGFTDARVAMNVHGSWCNHALALGMDKDASMRDQFSVEAFSIWSTTSISTLAFAWRTFKPS